MQSFIAGSLIVYFCFIENIQRTDQYGRGNIFGGINIFIPETFNYFKQRSRLLIFTYQQVPDKLGKTVYYKITFKPFAVDIIVQKHGAGQVLAKHAIKQLEIIVSVE